jgi:hypothetical protein
MFERFEKAREATKSKLATEICQALTVHAQVKEELFYPAAHEASGNPEPSFPAPSCIYWLVRIRVANCAQGTFSASPGSIRGIGTPGPKDILGSRIFPSA